MNNKVTKFSAIIWIICVIGVFATTGYVVGIRKELFYNTPNIFAFLLLGFFLLGCLAFLVGLVSLLKRTVVKESGKKQNIITTIIKLFFFFAIFPVYLIFYVLKPFEFINKLKQSGFKKVFRSVRLKSVIARTFALLAIIFMIFPIWIGGYTLVAVAAKEVLGYGTEPISVSGTGSMYPTFPKGEGKDPKELVKEIVGTPGMMRYPNGIMVCGKRFFGYQIGRGDIVVIENELIREMSKEMYGEASGWIKRIIGLPEDTLELREGMVYLNGEPLKEPYIAGPRSTFGETFLSECKKVTVPNDSIFVMGDNRKGSGDSREVGFIEISSINHVFPLKNQAGVLDKAWRDTSKDFDEASKIKLDRDEFLRLLNEKRKEAGVKELTYQPKLEVSAGKRGETILEFDDFSFEATQSGYTMSKAMRDANYSNIAWGEAPTQGYYEAEELIDNQFQFPESKKFLLDKTFQEIGVAEVEGEINGCPAQVIIQHFAGYVPPNYKKEDIESWKNNLSRLREIQSSWTRLKDNASFYQKNKTDVDRINELISIRIANISAIVARMEANQWFTAAEQKIIDQDKALYDEQEALATKLNNQ